MKIKILKIIVIGLILIILTLMSLALYNLYPKEDIVNNINNNLILNNNVDLKNDLEKGNAIVINIWLLEDSRLDKIRQRKIKYLIVDVGGIDSSGRLETPEEEINEFLYFMREYETKNNYEFILLPYSEVNTYNYNIEGPNFKENTLELYKDLYKLGFDGVFVDIEPIQFNQRDFYIDFIKELKNQNSGIMVVYSGDITNSADNENEWEWSPEFFREVSQIADIITIPGYDTDLTTKEEYENKLKKQVMNIKSGGFNTNILLGIPTHKNEPETIDNALMFYNEAIIEYQPENIIGYSIFSEWTIDDNEWAIFDRFV